MKYDDARSLETVPPNIVERDYGCGDQLKDPKTRRDRPLFR